MGCGVVGVEVVAEEVLVVEDVVEAVVEVAGVVVVWVVVVGVEVDTTAGQVCPVVVDVDVDVLALGVTLVPEDAPVPEAVVVWVDEAAGTNVEVFVLPATVVCTLTGMLIVGDWLWP